MTLRLFIPNNGRELISRKKTLIGYSDLKEDSSVLLLQTLSQN